MTAFDSTILSQLRSDLDDLGGDPVFSDDELEALYVSAGEVHAQTMVLAINRLLMNAAKLEDYTKAHEQLKGQEVFNRLKDLQALWLDEAKRTETQIAIAGLQTVPRRDRIYPYTQRWPTNLRRFRRW